MKNYLKVGIASLIIGTSAHAQQVLKRTTDTSTATIVETFVAANGNNPNNIVGPLGFSGASTSEGDTSFRTPSSTSTLGFASSTYLTPPTIPNETIGNGTFQTVSNSKKTVSNYQNASGTQTLNITTEEENNNRDAIEDTNTNNDVLYYKVSLPKTLDGGASIEVGTWAAVNTRLGVDINNGSNVGDAFLYFQRNGTTRAPKPTNRNGVAGANLQSIDNNGQLLGINEFVGSTKDNSKIYPNPIGESFSFDDGDNNPHEKINYQFIDMTGKIIESGTLTENEPQQLSQPHRAGIETIVLKDDEGNVISKKVIKK